MEVLNDEILYSGQFLNKVIAAINSITKPSLDEQLSSEELANIYDEKSVLRRKVIHLENEIDKYKAINLKLNEIIEIKNLK